LKIKTRNNVINHDSYKYTERLILKIQRIFLGNEMDDEINCKLDLRFLAQYNIFKIESAADITS